MSAESHEGPTAPRRAGERWSGAGRIVMVAMASAVLVACDDAGATDPKGGTAVEVSGQVALDGGPVTASVALEDWSASDGVARNLASVTTGPDGGYSLSAEVDASRCPDLYVTVLVVIVREGSNMQIGASEPTRGCGARRVDFALATP